MMLNTPMVDWLTLTTYETRASDAMRYLVIGEDWEPEKRLQYNGIGSGSLFLGDALQRGKSHYMFVASGESADQAYSTWSRNFGPYDWNVTRIDLQVTVPLPAKFDSRALYDDIVAWDGPGRPRKAAIVQSGDGLDTVYIGSRTSDRFTRIYIKPLDSGLRALRFEVEYKGDHAHRVANDCRTPGVLHRILAHEVQSLPNVKFGVLAPFIRVLGPEAHRPEIKRATAELSTLDWLRRQVTPTLERLTNSHEHGNVTRQLVKAWYDAYCNDDTNGQA